MAAAVIVTTAAIRVGLMPRWYTTGVRVLPWVRGDLRREWDAVPERCEHTADNGPTLEGGEPDMGRSTWIKATGLALATALLLASLALSGCGAQDAASTSSGVTTQTAGGPPGAPPNGAPPGGAPSATPKYTPTGAYSLSSGSATKSGAISAANKDQSGVLVTQSGSLTLTDANVSTTGNSSSSDESSFYGLNAGVLAQSGGKISMTGGSVKTTGDGANDIFAYGTGTSISVSGTTIDATGQYAHGIMASGGGAITATNVTANTTGGSSAPIATDRGSGTITVNGGAYTCSGNNSPAIYSTGKVTANGGTYVASGSEVLVIEGANSATLNNATLTAKKAGKWGVMIYQSMSGDAEGAKGVYTQTGGSLTEAAADSPLFYVTNTTGVITLKGVKVASASNVLVKAAAGQWGTNGSNGGTVQLTADGQTLTGSIVADKISSVTVSLRNGSTLTGAVNSAETAKAANVVLDSTSTWSVAGDSHLTTLVGAKVSGSTITNVKGNGHTITYDKTASVHGYLGGRTYALAGGGTLVAE